MSDTIDRLSSVRRHTAETIAVMRHVSATLARQREMGELDSYPEVGRRLSTISGGLAQCISHLERHLGELGGASLLDSARELTTRLTGGAAGLVAHLRAWPVSRIVRDDIVALTTVATSTSMLHSLALARGVEALGASTERQLETVSRYVHDLTELLPSVVVREAAAREPIASLPDATARATHHARRAWERATHRST